MSTKPKLLVVLTSQSILPTRKDTKTGWYLPEFAHPYNALAPFVDIVVASPKGGEAPLDPFSVVNSQDDQESVKFFNEKQFLWKNTAELSKFLGQSSEFAGVFYVGGHGPMFDLAVDEISQALIREFYESGKIVSAVCHGPGALVNTKLSDGEYLVKGQEVTGFSNAEEDVYQFTDAMPFLLENELKNHGANYVKANEPFGVKVVVSGKNGRLITGQNPPSAGVIGSALLEAIKKL
ncbi:DJ-1/Pfpl family intracellular protease family protein [Colletotrichum incanum]|nr:DJ-1/Pfpl family intracellular protease family protein [Colletotrichum incanum]